MERQAVANQITKEFALSENLDIFLGVEEDSKPDDLMYFTSHGFRSLNQERSYLNQFVVTKKGLGFSKGRDLPYIYRKKTTWLPPQLIVRFPTEEASNAGYAEAISLPYTVAGVAHDYPQGTLIVCLTIDNEDLATGYANAIKLPLDYRSVYGEDLEVSDDDPFPIETGEVYIHHIDMLDTEYAAMLEKSPRF